MVEHIVVELFLEGHYRQYLLRKLDRRVEDLPPAAAELRARISELLGLRLRVAPDSAEAPPGQRGRIQLTISSTAMPQIDPATHERIMLLVRTAFNREFTAWVDHEHYVNGLPKLLAAERFLHLYGIQENQYSLQSALRLYRRYERRQQRRLQRGRPKSPAGRRVLRELMKATPVQRP